jgi:rubredoxin
MQCKLCKTPFEPSEGQKRFRWCLSWCEYDEGRLCPACSAAARSFGKKSGIEGEHGFPIMRACPYGSAIAAKSAAFTAEAADAMLQGESFFVWNATHYPELYTAEERRIILGGGTHER